MWHDFTPARGAHATAAAPLLIQEIIIRHYFEGHRMEEKLEGKLDTAASMSVIPILTARRMQLPSAGRQYGMQPFDHAIDLPEYYPKFKANLFIPKMGWKNIDVIGCQRDGILLGRDICKEMLLVADWRRFGFGMRTASKFHYPLRYLFSRFRKVRE